MSCDLSMCSPWEIFAQINTNYASIDSNFKLLGALTSLISIRVLSISAVENSHSLNLLFELIVRSSLIQLGDLSKDAHIRKNRRARSTVTLKIWEGAKMTRRNVVKSRRNLLSSETVYTSNYWNAFHTFYLLYFFFIKIKTIHKWKVTYKIRCYSWYVMEWNKWRCQILKRICRSAYVGGARPSTLISWRGAFSALCRLSPRHQIGKDAIVQRVQRSLNIALREDIFVFGVLHGSDPTFVISYEVI